MRRFSLDRILAAAMMTAAMAMTAHAGDTEGLRHGTADTSRTGPTEVRGFRKYWHSLIYGNVDRTFDKKMDISFAVAPSYTREGSVGIGGAALLTSSPSCTRTWTSGESLMKDVP